MKINFIKTNFVTVVLFTAVVVTAVFALWPTMTKAAPPYFAWIQSSWVGGADPLATTSHNTGQNGQTLFSKFYSPTTYVNSGADVKLGVETGTAETMLQDNFTETQATLTSRGAKFNNVYIDEAADSLKLSPTVTDPFVNDLRQWRGLPGMPYPDKYTTFVRLGDYLYCSFASGDGRQFGRISIAAISAAAPTDYTSAQTLPQWEFLAPVPKPVASGSAMCTDGQYIYLLRGSGSQEVFFYLPEDPAIGDPDPNGHVTRDKFAFPSPAVGEWAVFGKPDFPLDNANLKVAIGMGGYIAHVGRPLSEGGANTDGTRGRLYVLVGNYRKTFKCFDVGYGTPPGRWMDRTDIPVIAEEGGRLAYPGGDYIYAAPGNDTPYVYAYNITGDSVIGNKWTSVSNLPDDNGAGTARFWEGSVFKYPGTGNYIYAACTQYSYQRPTCTLHTRRGFYRLGPVGPGYNGQTAVWQRLDDLPAELGYSDDDYERGTIYDPTGTGEKLHLFSGKNYTRPWSYDISQGHWETPSQCPLDTGAHGINLCYDTDSGDYIYYAIGSGSSYFFRYSISTNTWEHLANIPQGIHYSGNRLTYLDGYVYCLQGYNKDGFYRFNTSTLEWEVLGQYSSTDNAAFPFYDGQDDYSYNDVNYGSGIIGVNINGNKYVYALRGSYSPYNNSSYSTYHGKSFYRIDVSGAVDDVRARSWEPMADTPTYDTSGNWRSFRGCDMAVAPGIDPDTQATGTYIYATHGRNTTVFWKYGPLEEDFDGDGEYGTWTRLPNAPHKFEEYYYGGAKIQYPGTGNYIYAFCGDDDYYGYGFLCSRYDIYGNDNQGAWEELEPTPYLQKYTGMAMIGDTLYAAHYTAGTSATWYSNNSFHIAQFDETGRTWRWNENVIDRHLTTIGSVSVVQDIDEESQPVERLYVTYGRYDYDIPSHIWVYTPRDRRWTGLLRAPFTISIGCKSAYLENAGPGVGQSGALFVTEGKTSKKFWRYDIENKTWQSRCTLSKGSWRGTQLTPKTGTGVLYALCYGDLQEYSANDDVWSTVKSDDTTQFSHCSNVLVYAKNGMFLQRPGTDEFKFFNFNTQNWDQLAPVGQATAAGGSDTLVTDYGAGMAYSPSDDSVYLIPLQGFDYILRFDCAQGFWDYAPNMPLAASWGSSDLVLLTSEEENDWIFAFNPEWGDHFMRYHLTAKVWDELRYLPRTLEHGGTLCGAKGSIYFVGGGAGKDFYKYDIALDSWVQLPETPGSYGAWCVNMIPVEYQGELSLYVTQGSGQYGFWKYNLSKEKWVSLQSPADAWGTSNHSWGEGSCIIQAGDYIYAMRGYGTTSFWRYSLERQSWDDEGELINSNKIYWGASMVYPGGNYIYVLLGGQSTSFYRYNIAPNIISRWESVTSCPVTVTNSQSKLIYPGFGKYIYYLQGSSYWTYDESFVFLRYRLPEGDNGVWEELTPTTFSVDTPGTLVYAGDECFYTVRGRYRRNFAKYYAFSFGNYTSDIKEIGNHCGWGVGSVNWTDKQTSQSIEVGVRTGNVRDMSDAVQWDQVISVAKMADISQ